MKTLYRLVYDIDCSLRKAFYNDDTEIWDLADDTSRQRVLQIVDFALKEEVQTSDDLRKVIAPKSQYKSTFEEDVYYYAVLAVVKGVVDAYRAHI